jgi:hypothetical protein
MKKIGQFYHLKILSRILELHLLGEPLLLTHLLPGPLLLLILELRSIVFNHFPKIHDAVDHFLLDFLFVVEKVVILLFVCLVEFVVHDYIISAKDCF